MVFFQSVLALLSVLIGLNVRNLGVAASEFSTSASNFFRSDFGQIVLVISAIAGVLLVVVWLAFATLVFLSSLRAVRAKGPANRGVRYTAWVFIQSYFQPLIFTLKPIIYLLTFKSSNESYLCPRCNSKTWYMSKEQTTNTAVGGIINNPNGPDIGFVRQLPYDKSVRRCKDCNTQMDTYESTSYRKWVNTWQTIGYSLLGLVIGAALPAIVIAISNY